MDKCIVLLFYRATVESIVFYSITTGFGNLSTKLRSQKFKIGLKGLER